MNMIGHPKHVQEAVARDVDIIWAEGGEGGGHTGYVPFSILIPACLDELKGKNSALTGRQVRSLSFYFIFALPHLTVQSDLHLDTPRGGWCRGGWSGSRRCSRIRRTRRLGWDTLRRQRGS